MTIPNWDNSALKNGLFLLTDEELEEVLKQQKEKSDEAYQRFTRCAPSRGATYVKQFSEANTMSRLIKKEMHRRKKGLPMTYEQAAAVIKCHCEITRPHISDVEAAFQMAIDALRKMDRDI